MTCSLVIESCKLNQVRMDKLQKAFRGFSSVPEPVCVCTYVCLCVYI